MTLSISAAFQTRRGSIFQDINKENMRIWSAASPHEFVETPLHPQKSGFEKAKHIEPIFFNQTVTAARYRNDLLEPLINELHNDELIEGYSQQDNATAHSVRQTIAYLKEFFDTQVVEFPARPLDLTIMDYFIYPHLKNTVFRSTRHTMEELCEIIRDVCANITPQQLENAFDNMKRRVHVLF
jgi:hypothetical protein